MSSVTNNQVITSLAAWFGVDADTARRAVLALGEEEQRELDRSLRFSHSRKERLFRLLFTDVLNALPRWLYRRVTDTLKRLRGRSGATPNVDFTPGPLMALASRVAEHVGPQLQAVTVVLTHDIDTRECAEFWPEVAKAEEEIGVRSTYNVLTQGPYQLDHGWLREIETRGFEIGLHGDTHDMAIGFRKTPEVRDRLRTCRDQLGQNVIGYRAPALAISEPLLAILDELGFRYDSSLKASCFYSGGVPVCLPYLYGALRLWELPLAVADDGLFRDISLSEGDALQVIRSVVGDFSRFSGLLVFNSHPGVLREHMRFYRNLLDYLTSDPSVTVVLARDLVSNLDKRAFGE